MTPQETTDLKGLTQEQLVRFVQSLGEATTRFSAWNDARVTRKALSKLTDRELDDIGLCRGDVELIGR